mgnify:CR=1 FL=1
MKFKDYYSGNCAEILGAAISKVQPDFDVDGYKTEVDSLVPPLELNDRVLVLAEGLRDRLPASYPEAIDVLLRSLGPELAEGEGMFNQSWFLMPIARFVQEYGLEYPELSLAAIEQITRRHTGEFAIRQYLEHHPELTMTYVEKWANSSSHNVRRLASEGIRPRLPWATRYRPFLDNPAPVIAIISVLINDPSAYVRTSVANNLNDISKDHPKLAVRTARDWLNQSPTKHTTWIVKHGIRGLIKAGDEAALELLGVRPDPRITIDNVTISPPTIAIGETAEISATIYNGTEATAELIVDYRVYFVKKNGERKPTTFKLKRLNLAPNESATVTKVHKFHHTTTRTLYPGLQELVVTANGSISVTVGFELVASKS